MGLAEFTKRQLNKRGFTEVMFDSYTPEQKDCKSIVDKLVNKKTDVLYAGGYQRSIFGISCAGECPVPVRRGKAGEGSYFTFGPDMRLNPEAGDVVAAIREEDAYEPEGYTLYSYGAVQA